MQFRLILTVPDQRIRAIALRKKEELTRTLIIMALAVEQTPWIYLKRPFNRVG